METIYAAGSPVASYLEGNGAFEPDQSVDTDASSPGYEETSFAPPNTILPSIERSKRHILPPLTTPPRPTPSLRHIHDKWSTAINSRLGRAHNAQFLEHFRYILVASQLLNEYLDQGAFPPLHDAESVSLEAGESPLFHLQSRSVTIWALSATVYAAAALLNGARVNGYITVITALFWLGFYISLVVLGYMYARRMWLQKLRHRAVHAATELTTSWHGFEVSSTSAISLVQEVELVSKGYRLCAPLPPISRVEDAGVRRCARLRKILHTSYLSLIPACRDAITLLRKHAADEDLDLYYDIYDVNGQDVRDSMGPEALTTFEDDPESLKSLRLLSFRAGVLRRAVLCHLMSLHADGGWPDTQRWQQATNAMLALKDVISSSMAKITKVLQEMETLNMPMSPTHRTRHSPTREKMRSQVRKISTLSTGIRTLQAKMQILRDETNRSIEQSDDLGDLGPDLLTQYDSIGSDLKELMQAWELGKTSLQTNLNKQEQHRISMASSGLRSPVSSLGGLTAVDEDSSPADALLALTGDLADIKSKRSSMVTTSSEDEVFEAIALPKQRSTLTREERIAKMYEERERQVSLRMQRDASTSMLKELETVISLRPKSGSNGARTTTM